MRFDWWDLPTEAHKLWHSASIILPAGSLSVEAGIRSEPSADIDIDIDIDMEEDVQMTRMWPP